MRKWEKFGRRCNAHHSFCFLDRINKIDMITGRVEALPLILGNKKGPMPGSNRHKPLIEVSLRSTQANNRLLFGRFSGLVQSNIIDVDRPGAARGGYPGPAAQADGDRVQIGQIHALIGKRL
jgi:uncharacterized protein YfaQ (DUF2300 family)